MAPKPGTTDAIRMCSIKVDFLYPN